MEGPRGARKEEFDQVLEIVDYVFRGGGNQPPMREQYSLLFNYDNLDNMRILVEDGKPVSHIGISESEIVVYGCKTKIGSIGSVCTCPEYRERGFATRLLEDCINKLYEDEADIMLVSGGRGLYKRAGCVDVGKVYNFTISQNDLQKFDDRGIALYPYEDRDLENILKVYQKEPVRFYRSFEDFRKVLDRKAKILTLRMADDFLGYLIVQIPTESKAGQRVSNVLEYAGVRKAIVDAIKPIFGRYNVEELNLNIPFHDTEFIYVFEQKGLEPTTGSIPGTIKIINFPRLMDRFHPYIEERLGKKKTDSIGFAQDSDRFTIYFGQEKFDTDGKSLVQIVFGTGDGREKELMPKGEMSKVLVDIFPLPFPWPGLNSV